MIIFGQWVSKEDGYSVPDIEVRPLEDIIQREPIEAVIFKRKPVIWAIFSEKNGSLQQIDSEQIVFGSGSESDIQVNAADIVDPELARIYEEDETLFLENLNGNQAVTLNGRLVSEPVKLEGGERFRCGKDWFIVIKQKTEMDGE